ncbi:Cation efflux family protein [Pleurostoma richardsiae]|uniref:Cation efflux family protein n=1 Tax=Pleurostoma richardsiae TaxID=41990 RepID=A0AA38RVC1_9PEZI|nr:Cation efflux family protein [Pleurostoma richardsiae]
MASPPPPLPRISSWRKGSFALSQEDTAPLAPKGHSALTALIKSRSSVSLLHGLHHHQGHHQPGNQSPHWRIGDEEEAGGMVASGEWGTDDEEPALLQLASPQRPGRLAEERRMSAILNGPQMRSMRLIGRNNPRYRWQQYWKTEEQLRRMKSKIRKYYERTNYLIQQYLYIDRLLDSSLPHDLLNEYNDMPASAFRGLEVPKTISEEPSPLSASPQLSGNGVPAASSSNLSVASAAKKVKRTPRDIYRPTETTPLFAAPEEEEEPDDAPKPDIPWVEEEDVHSGAAIVTLAIYVNFVANAALLAGKIAVIISVPSVSVLASLVDAALDFLSTIIVWTTTWLIGHQDQYRYPIGRRRLEPLGVLVFSVIMIISFFQVAMQAIQRLASGDHDVIQLGIPAIVIMLSTIVIKGVVWLWFRLVNNSSVQALAADASTDVIFNAGSIAFPIVGFYARIWWLDALGGLLLSFIVIFNWSQTSLQHIRNLSGRSATADQRNILLYLTMRFAKTIKQIQGLQAYHAGDKLNVEVDIVLDASTSLKDSHDLSESLQYVLESVPIVDRAFVHVDYASYNLPTHMEQQAGR